MHYGTAKTLYMRVSVLSIIERLSRRTVYRNRWTTVHEDEIRFPGGQCGIYGVVEKTDFALVIPQHEDGRFQMVEQYRYPVSGRFWEFPAGALEEDPEADPAEIARTELEEETGLRAHVMIKLGEQFPASGLTTNVCHIYLATGLELGATGRESQEADMITAKFSRTEIMDMIQTGKVKDALTISAFGLLAIAEWR
ncbi:NUDIX hydrolase [Tropicibacter sp. Alg240-R139]|uniref:NUDIX domain-containing protein n=1 Tax=Tropicibacter sp. Alg240-R139 TaxID=2305991 RepID=UPI001F07D063|nr:NUDIX hydrolase [Tropicibacter sp. Alg240-R139]